MYGEASRPAFQTLFSDGTGDQGEAPVRITNYVEQVVPDYSFVEFKAHFWMERETFEVV